MLDESSEKSGKFNDRARKSPEFPVIFDLLQQVVPKKERTWWSNVTLQLQVRAPM
jgi:hypothetical protein